MTLFWKPLKLISPLCIFQARAKGSGWWGSSLQTIAQDLGIWWREWSSVEVYPKGDVGSCRLSKETRRCDDEEFTVAELDSQHAILGMVAAWGCAPVSCADLSADVKLFRLSVAKAY